MTINYNRSELYSFFDLTTDQQNEVLQDIEAEQAEQETFVIYKHKEGNQILPLGMFMRIDYPVNTKGLFDGVYSKSAFSAYFIKFNNSNDEVVIADKYF